MNRNETLGKLIINNKVFEGISIKEGYLTLLENTNSNENTNQNQFWINTTNKPLSLNFYYRKNCILRIADPKKIIGKNKSYIIDIDYPKEIIDSILNKLENLIIILENESQNQVINLITDKVANNNLSHNQPKYSIDHQIYNPDSDTINLDINGWVFFENIEENVIVEIISNDEILFTGETNLSRRDVSSTYDLSHSNVGFHIKIKDYLDPNNTKIRFKTSNSIFIKDLIFQSKPLNVKPKLPKIINNNQTYIVPKTNRKIIKKNLSYIIPTRFKSPLLIPLLKSLRDSNNKDEIIILAHNLNSSEINTLTSIADKVLELNGDFNWSYFNNYASEFAKYETLVFLNDDMYPANDDWRKNLEINISNNTLIGAKLLHKDFRVQHLGIKIIGNSAITITEPSKDIDAVTGAFICINKKSFEKTGKFDTNLYLNGNDTEFCIRFLNDDNHSIICDPLVTFYHFESTTRSLHEEQKLNNKYSNWILNSKELNYTDEIDSSILKSEPLHIASWENNQHEPNSIGIIKIDHIGDFFSCLPALQMLKNRFQKSQIVLFSSPEIYEIYSSFKIFDKCIPIRFFQKRSDQGKANPDFDISDYNFDLLIDLRKHNDAKKLIIEINAKLKFAMCQNIPEHLEELTRFKIIPFPCEIDGSSSQELPIWQEAKLFVNYVINYFQFIYNTNKPIIKKSNINQILIFPFSGSKVREWDISLYIRLIKEIRYINSKIDIIICSPSDETWKLSNFTPHFDSLNVVLKSIPTIGIAYELINHKSLVICNNSGPMWIASNRNAPFISIFSGVVNKRHWLPAGGLGISRNVTCSPCHIQSPDQCNRDIFCLNSISPKTIANQIKHLL